jgi:hypothetical protein
MIRPWPTLTFRSIKFIEITCIISVPTSQQTRLPLQNALCGNVQKSLLHGAGNTKSNIRALRV